MRRILAVAIAAAAAIGLTATPSSAESIALSGTGWKVTSSLGVTSISPTETYTVTFASEELRQRYSPYMETALPQVQAAGVHIKLGGVEAVNPRECGPEFHVQVMEAYRPTGNPGMSQAMPCPNQPNGMGRGGIIAYNSEYWDGSWYMAPHVLHNTIVHELLHTLGLDHPNTDLDNDGAVEPYECVATSYGNKPITCSPNGGYSTSNRGRLVHFDETGLKNLVNNARIQGLS